jgi:hypothetical protein
MSGTTAIITAEAGLFRNYTVDPTTVTDLQTAITTAITTAAGATASAAAAEADAATATTAATNAQSASTSAIAAVNAAASTAETTINAAVSSASTYASQASASATAAANSATAANTSATTAAAAVATSATNAASSAAAAASSASAAANSATTAGTSAASAAGSVTAAAASASAASTSATNAQTSATSAAASAVSAGGIFGQTIGRNYVQNARFQVQQRGAGPFTTNGTFAADRWALAILGDTVYVSVATLPFANRTTIGDEDAIFALQAGVTGGSGAGNYSQVYHSVENVARLSAKTVTLSFWANASPNMNVGVRINQNFGTGGSPSATVASAAQTAAVTSAFQRFSLTFTLPSISGKTVGTNGDHCTQILFAFSSGSTNSAALGVGVQTGTVSLYGVQLEVGTTATALEVKSYQQDFQDCLRFFQVFTYNLRFYASGANQYCDRDVYLSPMRATPSVGTTAAPANQNIGSLVFYPQSGSCIRVEAYSAAAGDTYSVSGVLIASADI